MKKRLAFLIPLLILSSCGEDTITCNDNAAYFPPDDYKINYKVRNTYTYELNNIQLDSLVGDSFINDYSNMPSSIVGDRDILHYANDTGLKKYTSLPAVRFPKLFDGQVSCAGSNANSFLCLYSDGIVIDLHKRLQSSSAITIYMKHNYLNLKLKAYITLYNPTDSKTANEYDAYEFAFYANLGTGLTPDFFYINLNNLSNLNNFSKQNLNGSSMIGFRFERQHLLETDNSQYFTPYVDKENEKPKSKDEEPRSFAKIYDISLPDSTWR